MGNLCSSLSPEQKAARARHMEIERRMKANKNKQPIKMLLLGPGESGKSTIFKQMKILGAGGYTQEELAEFKTTVYKNLISEMKVMLEFARDRSEPVAEWDSPEAEEAAARVLDLPWGADGWSADTAEDLGALWATSYVQTVYGMRDKHYQLNDSTLYFYSELDRIKAPGYCPNVQDALRARVRTTGIQEAEYEFDDLKFKMMDVGGQRSERRKWLPCFTSVTAVLFTASLSEYDQVLREDESTMRMMESLMLFEEICNSPWFNETPVILFLNKQDMFLKKIETIDLRVCFDDYVDGCNAKAAGDFIEAQFRDRAPGVQDLYVHQTIAVNTDNINVVFRAVKDVLLKDTLGSTFF